MFDVISIGAATIDIFVKSAAFNISTDLLTLPASSKNEMSSSLICSGGGATNSSVAFSRLGLRSACISLVGTDPLIQYIISDLSLNNVENLLINNSDTTDYSVILVANDGSRSILTNRGSSCLDVAQINFDLLKTKWLYITSLEGNLDLLEHLIGFAVENKINIALNPGNRELEQLSRLIPLLKYVNFLLLNKTEFDHLADSSVDKLLSYKAQINAVTNGREGAHIYSGHEKLFSPIINTTPVDETGAGDAFGSTFIASLILGNSLETSLEWGIKNSASVVSYLGAKPGLLKFDQINAS